MLSPPELPPPALPPLPRLPPRPVELPLRARAAVDRLAVFGLEAVERDAPAVPDFARAPPLLLLLRVADPFDADDDLRAPRLLLPLLLLRLDEERPEPPDDALLAELPSSEVHLPDNTRCAASATASAISEPSRVALLIMLVAAWLAVSAASMPASRMARRAFGLAAIAVAAAVRPAASISLLIAAFASLSTVDVDPREAALEPLVDSFAERPDAPDDLERVEDLDDFLLVVDFAIEKRSLQDRKKDTSGA